MAGLRTNAFSLLEVMIALSIFAVILSAIVANMASLSSARQFTRDQQQANDLGRQIMEKIQALDFNTLGMDGHWSEPRFLVDDDGEEMRGLSVDELRAAGVFDGPIALNELEVFVECYRGIDAGFDGQHLARNNAANPGLMQYVDETADAYLARSSSYVLDQPSPYRLPNREAIAQVGTDPVVFRIVIRWDGRLRYELMTARRKGSTS